MEPAISVGLLWLLFGGLHIGLTTRRIRAALVARLGEGGFMALFSLLASATFAALITYYAAHRFAGAPGPALGNVPALRWTLMALVVSGIVLVAGGSVAYPGSPYDSFGRTIRAPRGIERVTRHPFFTGTALFALAHALLATRLVGTVVFAGIALIAVVGAWHQDAKLLARRGKSYAEYLGATSALPFTAIAAGRQRIAWREFPLGAFAVGLGLALALRAVHASIFADGGVWVVLTVVGGGANLTWQSWRRARRAGVREASVLTGDRAERVA
jgi:uncharacterized membrane protein